MPDGDFLPNVEDQPVQGDLLEQLLVVAAEKAAKREAEDALKKGFVTREQINSALAAFGDGLEDRIVDRIIREMQPKTETIVQKALSTSDYSKKSTVLTEEEERDADPVQYLLKKGRTLGPEAYDDTDKQIIWALTYKGLAQGMDNGEVAGE